MTARSKDSGRSFKVFRFIDLILLAGSIAYKDARAVLNGSGKVIPASSSPVQQAIGHFTRKVDAYTVSADKTVSVDLGREVLAYWYANHTAGDAVLSTDLGRLCYHLDDDTVTITPTNRSVAGRIWAVSATKGVLVEPLPLPDRLCRVPTAIAFVANDYVLTAAACLHDSIIDVPLTGAASTITLPAAAPDGTRISFAADGTKNGHAITYRDATGPTSLTTALTASKRHLVICQKQAGAWFANAYVSP